MDPRKANGAVFLGLEGIAVKSHGGADALGVASAIDVAYDMANFDLRTMIRDSLAATEAQRMSLSFAAEAEQHS
ncbi:MAG: hypothetical protein BGP06_07845 [Rhizobiales bacterium 65-9]|nr:MAG: hypothetical protein BGP06_07845 [Rhizobiales bacterium 65-9]